MIENLFTTTPKRDVNEHLRPADLPKTLYLPGAKFFPRLHESRTSPDPTIRPGAIHLLAYREKYRTTLYSEREPLHLSTLRPNPIAIAVEVLLLARTQGYIARQAISL